MHRSLKFGLSLGMVLGMLSLAPTAKADEWDKRTIVTFHEPVEVPGKVLPAGTYVMKLLDNSANRDIVQIFNKDESKILDTVMGVAAYRDTPASKTVITFEERAANSPEAIKDWYYPGDLYGVEFTYPNYHPKANSNEQIHTRPAPQYETVEQSRPAHQAPPPPPANTMNSNRAMNTRPAPPPQQMAMAKPEPAPTPAPAPAPQANNNPAPKPMPKTASDLPLIGSLGAIAMFAGIVLRKRIV